ncbi:GPI transamidase component Tta1, putative [Bodo saltans]|uniref:GPI transamidase component Tta1, putative n=1 Tax=Bodo saltans TaxID=75058 RepID=A0A0S4J337_BODSA|nr:GPI transamidase component Tta1, putative [Bodo saltans]|eukprot:CUG63197.1 GPI transamidase component Tta1, putative [Bodo saltans]
MYAALSSTERSSIDLQDAVRRTASVCRDIDAHARTVAVAVPPTRPPPMEIHVHVILCPATADDDAMIDTMPSSLYGALATIRGLLNYAASNGGSRGTVNMVEEVPALSMTLSKSPLRVCKAARKTRGETTAAAGSNVHDDEDEDEMTAEEAASVGSLVVDATTQSWVVMTTVRQQSSPIEATSTCQRDHNRRMWCTLVLPSTLESHNNTTNDGGSVRMGVRKWVGGVVASILGIQSFHDIDGVRSYLTNRRSAACRFVVYALSGLAQVLDAAPTMPLAVALGDSISKSVDAITLRPPSTDSVEATRTVRSAAVVERCSMDPSLLPQMFYPLEHLLAVHLSFLLPVVVAFIAGLGLTLKEWKRQRKAQRAALANGIESSPVAS